MSEDNFLYFLLGIILTLIWWCLAELARKIRRAAYLARLMRHIGQRKLLMDALETFDPQKKRR
jgi:hypothetical protein